jgi:hypothetical protein
MVPLGRLSAPAPTVRASGVRRTTLRRLLFYVADFAEGANLPIVRHVWRLLKSSLGSAKRVNSVRRIGPATPKRSRLKSHRESTQSPAHHCRRRVQSTVWIPVHVLLL